MVDQSQQRGPGGARGRRGSRRAARAAGGTAAALVLGAVLGVTPAAQAAPAAQARSASGAGAGSDSGSAAYVAAAREFGVPLDVLLGVSYQESRWDAHPGAYSAQGGFGPMGLTDVTPAMLAGGAAGAAGRGELDRLAADPARHTAAAAAALTGASRTAVERDAAQNIRAGAALLASYEKRLTGGAPADPAAWYPAVSRYSQARGRAARAYADAVFALVRRGAERTTAEGLHIALAPDPAAVPPAASSGTTASTTTAAGASDAPAAQCPPTLDCSFAPAATTNYQAANRPADGLDIRYIVIHDTESTYQQAIDSFQNPASGDAAQYVIRSSDGAITQTVPNEDVAFQAGNFWFNMHSIGIEHEGFAAHGAQWYTQAQYETTAELVRWLAAEYGVPLDREHIIGHDDVPGPADGYVAGMHWDPGPYWDWDLFMAMLDAPVDAGPHGVGPVGTAVTITPPFAANAQTVSVCPADDPTGQTPACTDRTEPSGILFVHTAPAADAPLVGDPYVHAGGGAGTDRISDWSATVSAGQQYVVADRCGDWTAIWFGGQKGWIHNPGGADTSPAYGVRVLTAGADAPVYGSGYPQPSEYPAGLSPSTQKPLSEYGIPAGQSYVATSAPVRADDFFHNPPDTVVRGAASYYTVQFDHRVVLVDAADVTAHPARAAG